MKNLIRSTYLSCFHTLAVAALVLIATPLSVHATDQKAARVNKYGAPVLQANGERINYDRKSVDAMLHKKATTKEANATARVRRVAKAREFVPSGGQTQQPFWQYAIFGSAIGASNIVIGPTPPTGAPEIIIGGNSRNDFGNDDFWQVIRRNPVNGDYDTLFVSRLYCAEGDCTFNHGAIKRIGLAHVTNAVDQQIVVMLEDGRIYLYDFSTKTELGYLDTGISGLEALSLTDLDGDGRAELIVATVDNFYVFNGSAQLLWEVNGAGGYDVVAGQMDNDPAIEIAGTNGKIVDAATHGVSGRAAAAFGPT